MRTGAAVSPRVLGHLTLKHFAPCPPHLRHLPPGAASRPSGRGSAEGLTPGLLSLFILLTPSPPAPSSPLHTLRPALPGKRGTELSPLPPPLEVCSPRPLPQQGGAWPPSGPPWGRPGSLPLSPLRFSHSGLGPWLHPSEYSTALVSVCVGVRVHVPPFEERKCPWPSRQGVCWLGGGGGNPSVWCYPCLSAPGSVTVGATPTPTLPAQ